MINKALKLSSYQIEVPTLGLGTWKVEEEKAREIVSYALRIGYRHIDTADRYGNHKGIGKALEESEVNREDLFLTSKVWRSNLYSADVKKDTKRFLEELGSSYLDLLLVHWPNSNIPIGETMGAFKELQEEGIIRAIGVSNFTVSHLKEVLETGVEVDVNQVELHPSFKQRELRDFCARNGIVVTAYSPLGRGKDLELPEIKEIAEKHSAGEAQVIINWIISEGMVAIPKSEKPKRVKSNFDSLNLELDGEDIQKIEGIEDRERIINFEFSEFDKK